MDSSVRTAQDAAASLAVDKLTDGTYGLQYSIPAPSWGSPTSADVSLNAWALLVTSQPSHLPPSVLDAATGVRPVWQKAMIT